MKSKKSLIAVGYFIIIWGVVMIISMLTIAIICIK